MTDTLSCPLDATGRTPYAAYAETDVLAGLLHPVTDEPAEVSFIIATQVMELHFTLLLHEWRLTTAALVAEDLPGALAALRRSVGVQANLVRSWDLLSTMTPVEYSRFREQLGAASGGQSCAYREMEFVLGAKSAAMLGGHTGADARRLQRAFDAPSLYDTAVALLARRGVAVPITLLARDVREPRTAADDALVQAWLDVYSGSDRELVELAEVLTAVAQAHSTWRFVHYTSVRRILGTKPGTGGSAGLAWLKRAVDAEVFVDLWAVRSAL